MMVYELFLLVISNQPREVWWASCLSPQFIEEETEVQSVQLTFPKTHSESKRQK